jgi:hypothetical protein
MQLRGLMLNGSRADSGAQELQQQRNPPAAEAHKLPGGAAGACVSAAVSPAFAASALA